MDLQDIIQDLTPPADLLLWQSEDFARPVSSERSEVYRAKVADSLDDIERLVTAFTLKVSGALAKLSLVKFPLSSEIDPAVFDETIVKLEAAARDEAIAGRRMERDFALKAKAWKKSDPSMVFEIQKASQRFCTLSEIAIEVFLSTAMQARTFRSKLRPRRIAGSFNNSVDLAHFLEGAIGGR